MALDRAGQMSTPEQQYSPAVDLPVPGYDEAWQADGSVRPHWQYLIEGLNTLGPEALRDRHLKATRILRDDGATYTTPGDVKISQTWQLDTIPLLIDSEEWSSVEAGLRERAELFNLLLDDIYGSRELLKHRILPPELLFGHPGFLRPAFDVRLRGDQQLIFHATDLVRDSSGEIRVIADRTQAPGGDGYALENRTVISRVLPSLFRDSHVHRLALFFRNLRRKLNELSPNHDIPRVVLLTPGPYSRNYFEQVYLANYLGYPLVQGSDLTVRNGYLWMKALDGLSRVDVVLRRVDDAFCDPVELKSSSFLGVPGILEVARAGRVTIVNPVGVGVLESAALNKYLPAIAQYFLGREPRMRAAATWWCGDEADCRYVLDHLPQLVIKRTAARAGTHSLFGPELDEQRLAEVRTAILRHPLQFTAQELFSPSRVPTLQGGALVPRPMIMRSFAVASDSSYTIMPGGLARVAEDDSTLAINAIAPSISKDIWILASEPEKQVSLRPAPGAPERISDEHDTDIPSRVVENLFWFGRYAERAEFTARLLRTVFMQLNSTDQLPAGAYPQLLQAITHVTLTYPGFTADDPALFDNPEPELLSLVLDADRGGSISASLLAMVRAGEEVKELLSSDTRRILTDVRDEIGMLNNALQYGLVSAPEEALDPLVTQLVALAGLSQESMVRGIGWRFLEMGRRLERAQLTVALIRAMLAPVLPESDQTALLQPLLVSLEAVITYRRRFRGQLNVVNGLELLMLDKSNPRALIFQLETLRDHLHHLPSQQRSRTLTRENRLILELSTQLQLSDLAALVAVDPKSQRRAGLDQLLSRLKHLLLEAANLISERYFEHAEGPQPLVRASWEEVL